MSEHWRNYNYGYTSDRQARKDSADKVHKSRGARRDHGSSSRREEAGSSSSQAKTGGYNAGYTDETQWFDSPPPISYAQVLDTTTNTWEKCGNPLEPGLGWCRAYKPVLYCNSGGCPATGQEEHLGAGFSCAWHTGIPKSYEAMQRERAKIEAAAASVPQVRAEIEKERERTGRHRKWQN